MKKIYVAKAPLMFLMMSFFVVFPIDVSAHILKKDDSIGVVIHVDPSDDPIAGEPSRFYLEFKDKEGEFDPRNCTCTVKILRAGDSEQVFEQDMLKDNPDPTLSNITFVATFPAKDLYTIQINGNPTTEHSFEPFSLSYDMRVSREVSPATSSTDSPGLWVRRHVLHVVGLGIFILLFIVLFIQQEIRGKKLISDK